MNELRDHSRGRIYRVVWREVENPATVQTLDPRDPAQIELCELLPETEGVPPDPEAGAIGSQARLNVSITFDAMDQCLADLKSLGLPVHITEPDVLPPTR